MYRREPTVETDTPTSTVLRAYERRSLLVTPDRRTFIQSMYQDSARRISGNAVPAHMGSADNNRGAFAYTFPSQRFAQTPYSIPSQSHYHGKPGPGGEGQSQMGSAPRAPSPAASSRGVSGPNRSTYGSAAATAASPGLRYNTSDPEYVSVTPRYDPPRPGSRSGTNSSYIDADEGNRYRRRPY